jgi:hypothetical protein
MYEQSVQQTTQRQKMYNSNRHRLFSTGMLCIDIFDGFLQISRSLFEVLNLPKLAFSRTGLHFASPHRATLCSVHAPLLGLGFMIPVRYVQILCSWVPNGPFETKHSVLVRADKDENV